MPLWIEDSTETDDALIISACQVAEDYFEAKGVTPAQCYAAKQAEANGEDFDARLTEIWLDAETAAFKSLFDGWASWPEIAVMTFEG